MARRRNFPGARGLVFAAILVAGALAGLGLGAFAPFAPGAGGRRVAAAFFSRALTPSLVSEAPPPFGGASLLPAVLEGTKTTIEFAAAALALATGLGSILGFFGSTAWWADETPGGGSRLARAYARTAGPVVYGATRVLISLLRSVHELLWAVILLSAFGRSDLTAVFAIAIPYTGMVAKIFSEIVDEVPRGPAAAMRGAGATAPQIFLVGLLPRALPDVTAYLFYQFECALRSSTILGFFGFPTLGYYIAASFENLYYGEVWLYLYALLVLVVAVEVWSGAIRKRLAR